VRRIVVVFRANLPGKRPLFSKAEGPGEKVRRLDGGEDPIRTRGGEAAIEWLVGADLRNGMIGAST
jgi:hypothetical protein